MRQVDIGEERPREPLSFYYMLRPNTALWAARIITIYPIIHLVCLISFPDFAQKTATSLHPVYFLLGFLWMFCIMMSPALQAGIWQHTKRVHMDEFELAHVDKARQFSYRILITSVFIAFAITGLIPHAAKTLFDVSILQNHTKLNTQAIYFLLIVAFTAAPAYYHWTLKPVPPEDNIRQPPSFFKEEIKRTPFWRK